MTRPRPIPGANPKQEILNPRRRPESHSACGTVTCSRAQPTSASPTIRSATHPVRHRPQSGSRGRLPNPNRYSALPDSQMAIGPIDIPIRRSRKSRSGLAITLRHDRRMLAGERVIGPRQRARISCQVAGAPSTIAAWTRWPRYVSPIPDMAGRARPGAGRSRSRPRCSHVLAAGGHHVYTALGLGAPNGRRGRQQTGRAGTPPGGTAGRSPVTAAAALPGAGGGPDDHGRPGSPGPGHAAPPVLLGEQVIGVGLDEQLSEHRVHRGFLAVPGLRNDQLPPACPARGVAVSHRADTAAVSSRTPMTREAAGHRRPRDGYE